MFTEGAKGKKILSWVGYKKLQLKQVLGIDPYKTKYHFKACKQPNFDNVGFSPLKCWDDNWAEREKYLICFFNQFKCACVLLFLQTIFGKSINTGWFLIDIFFQKF